MARALGVARPEASRDDQGRVAGGVAHRQADCAWCWLGSPWPSCLAEGLMEILSALEGQGAHRRAGSIICGPRTTRRLITTHHALDGYAYYSHVIIRPAQSNGRFDKPS